jgi:hypothetical protein
MPAEGSQDAHEWVKVLAAEILVCRSRGLRVTFPVAKLSQNPEKRRAVRELLERLGVEVIESPSRRETGRTPGLDRRDL